MKDKTRANQRDIDSMKKYAKTGIKDKKGRVMLTSKDVQDNIKGLERVKAKREAKLSKKYDKVANKVNNKKEMSTSKKVAIGMAATAAITAGAYGAYKLSKIHSAKKAAGKKVLSDFKKMASESSLNNNLNKMDLDALRITDLSKNRKYDIAAKMRDRRTKNHINSKVMSDTLKEAKGKITRGQHIQAKKIVDNMMKQDIDFEMMEDLRKTFRF